MHKARWPFDALLLSSFHLPLRPSPHRPSASPLPPLSVETTPPSMQRRRPPESPLALPLRVASRVGANEREAAVSRSRSRLGHPGDEGIGKGRRRGLAEL